MEDSLHVMSLPTVAEPQTSSPDESFNMDIENEATKNKEPISINPIETHDDLEPYPIGK
jgi:hypothetical protein